MQIETERLLLQPFTDQDYEDLYELLSQRKAEAYEAYPNITYENGREHLQYRLGNEKFTAMVCKKNGKVIGNIYFGNRDFAAKELGYIVNKQYQRRGYAAEAIQAILREGFRHQVHRVYAECAPGNDCSWKLLEHLHFQREAHFRKNVYFTKDAAGDPIWQDTYVYSLLNPETEME